MKKRIYIDVSVLTLATFVTGIQRVTREITVRLIKDAGYDVVLLHYNAAEDRYHRIDNQAFANFYAKNIGVKEKMITKDIVLLEEIGEGSVFFDLDAAWMCRMKRSYLLPIIKKQGATIVAHIYDVISITHPQYCLERGVYNFMDFIGAHLQYADRIITNANATVEELNKLAIKLECTLPECHVVPLGSDFHDNRIVEDSEVSTNLIEATKKAPYLLMVGTIEPRKNHKLLLRAYDERLKDMGYNIIMAGYMGWNMESFAEKLKNHPDYQNGVYHFEGLDDRAITYLYQHAKALVFCSYTEGYGLPIVEALQRGIPVIVADLPIYREVAGDACAWFEQNSVDSLATVLENISARATASFDIKPVSWNCVAERVIKCLL